MAKGTRGIIMVGIHLISLIIFHVISAAVITVPSVISLNSFGPIFKSFSLLQMFNQFFNTFFYILVFRIFPLEPFSVFKLGFAGCRSQRTSVVVAAFRSPFCLHIPKFRFTVAVFRPKGFHPFYVSNET